MAEKRYRIVGRVVSSGSPHLGVPEVRVEAWDKDLLIDDFIASAVTGADGRFTMEFHSSAFRGFFFDDEPDLYFKVFDQDQLVKNTKDSVMWNVEAGTTEITIDVDIEVVEVHVAADTSHSEQMQETGRKDMGAKKYGYDDYQDKGSKKYGGGGQTGVQDIVTIVLKRYTALELWRALAIALGVVTQPKKKKGKGKKKGGGGKKYDGSKPKGGKPPGGGKPPVGGKPPGGGKPPVGKSLGGGKPKAGTKKGKR